MNNSNEKDVEIEDLQKKEDDIEEKKLALEREPSIWPMLALAAIFALCFRIFVFQPFNIPSGSMFPTLLVGDYIFVSKYSYGYGPYSTPDWLPIKFTHKGRINGKPPQRGDVVVFRQPQKLNVDYIKRVIGLPGDTVQVIEGRLYINGKIVPRIYEGVEELGYNSVIDVFSKYKEILPNGKEHFIYEKSDFDTYDNTELFTVPEDYYFVMGDNRDGSLDSRAKEHVGMVPFENLIGKARFFFFSTEGVGNKCPLGDGIFKYPVNLFCYITTLPKVIRYSRIFQSIN